MTPDEEQIRLIPDPDPDLAADADAALGAPQVARMAWLGETLDFAEAMRERGHAYGSYVNTSRAIPDVRDGLKPVQRRILFAMDELGVRSDRPYKKSATAVGQVIGYYHPHGDTAVYDAMVRLAQGFQSTTPLIDGQGNWGNVDGDPPAAMRYTEARLTALATDCLSDLRPEVVPYRPNFSETRDEPTVLPVMVPLILTLGQSGIGWSMASDIPPHAVGEVLAAAELLARRPDATLEDVMRVLPGPDFPSGGQITDATGLAEIYRTGQGTIQLHGRYVIEDLPGNQQAVLVTELPHQVGPDQIVRQVVQGARDGKITEVVEMPRNLTARDTGPRVQIKCKRGGNVQKLVADLLRHTKLRDTVKFNLTVLVDGKPKLIGLVEMLTQFVAFRHMVVAARLAHERSVLHRDVHQLLALISAVAEIDRVIAIIREADDDADACRRLIGALRYVPHGADRPVPIDETQATWIIEMRLRRLNRLNRSRLAADARSKRERIDEIDATLASDGGVRALVVRELRAAHSTFGVPRRTTIASSPGEPGEHPGDLGAEATQAGPAVVFASSAGMVLVADAHVRRTPRLPIDLGLGATPLAPIAIAGRPPLIAVTASGRALRANVEEAPGETRRGRGRPLLAIDRGDRIVAVLPDEVGASHCLLVSTRGAVKRVEWALVAASHAGGVVVVRLDDGDELVACVPHGDDDDVLIGTAMGRVLRLSAGAIRAVRSGGAGGVAGMTVADSDRVVGAVRATGDDLVTLHETGYAKRVAIAEYPRKGRGTSGVQSADTRRPARAPAGPVAVIAASPRDEPLLLITANGDAFAIAADDVPVAGRAAVSRPLVPLTSSNPPVVVDADGAASSARREGPVGRNPLATA